MERRDYAVQYTVSTYTCNLIKGEICLHFSEFELIANL